VLPAKAGVDLPAGEVVTIRTPGGGGWGKPVAAASG
jgi:N-methylhydantoinase B